MTWSGTSTSTGRFSHRESDSVAELFERIESLRARGRGYLEIQTREPATVLTIGFRDGHAVVHLLGEDGSTSLLAGDGSVHHVDAIDVPVFDEDATFTGAVVSRVDRAVDVVREFVRTGRTGPGEWHDL